MTPKPFLPLALIVLLTACGVDGDPVPPSEATPPSGLSVSGTVEVGISRQIRR